VKGANQSSGIPPSIQSLQSDQLANQQGAPVPAEYSASISGNLRQYGIKLKLSSKLCVDTVQKLSEILCRPGHNLLPLHTKLLIFKVNYYSALYLSLKPYFEI
jgi:hypothetical protein